MKDQPTPEQLAELELAWQSATISNDYLFGQLAGYSEIIERMLSIILGEEVELIEPAVSQSTIEPDKNSKGVRLDVKCRSQDKVFDIEIQVEDERNLFTRGRLYQGYLDVYGSYRGMEYSQIKESVIIFICKFDPMKRGKSAYIQQNYENDYVNFKSVGKLNLVPNKAKIIYLAATNYKNEENEDVRNFLSYMMGNIIQGDEFIDMLDNAVREIKLNPLAKSDCLKLMFREMDLKEDHRKELEKEKEKTKKEKQEKEKAKADIKKEKEKTKKEKKEKEKALAKEKQVIFNLLKSIEPETVCEVYNITMEELEQIKAEFEE